MKPLLILIVAAACHGFTMQSSSRQLALPLGSSADKYGGDDPLEPLQEQVADLPPLKQSVSTMSTSIPFLACPPLLIGCDYAGNFGFDPLGLASDQQTLAAYREAEIKHSRLAMLAAAGWPLSELFDRQIAGYFGWAPLVDDSDRVPSVLNGGLDKISPIWWGTCLGLTAAIDLYGVAQSRKGDPNYFPGRLGFDPLGLYPIDKEGQKRMELAEIKHGRLSMVAVVGFAVQEYVTKLGVVEETPQFFTPITETLQ